ncbi:MAG TPA: carboxypeptidase-like regulatory domain-containing protein [Pyrinomonadaceae bacterium]|nr:carboxypeptidase-like regulatory domain-containing protein [Pyrinomonadaceae bacterium]
MRYVLPLLLLLSIAPVSAQPAEGRPFSITGIVLDKENKPVAGARVAAYPEAMRWEDGRLPHAITGDDGRFVMGVPRATDYTIVYEMPASGYPSTYSRFYFPDDIFRPVVSVKQGHAAPTVKLRFPAKFGRVYGKLIDPDLKITDAQVMLCRTNAPKYCHTVRSSDSNLRFPIFGIEEPFSIHISPAGFEEWFLRFPGGVRTGDEPNLSIRFEKRRPEKPENMIEKLTSPVIVFPLDGSELGGGYPRSTRIHWLPVVGAVSYGVDIEVCQGGTSDAKDCRIGAPLQHFRMEPPSGIEKTSYEFNFVGGQPGRWRVWAIGPDGSPGPKTPWNYFYYRS